MESITVYTRRRGRAPALLPNSDRILDVAILDIALPPPIPLRVGQHVRISVLTPIGDCGPTHGPGEVVTYTSEPTDIAGRIVGVRALEQAVTEFVIKNDIYHSLTEHAYLSVPHIEGITANLGLWHWLIRTLLSPLLPNTRCIRFDEAADVTPRARAVEWVGEAPAGEWGRADEPADDL